MALLLPRCPRWLKRNKGAFLQLQRKHPCFVRVARWLGFSWFLVAVAVGRVRCVHQAPCYVFSGGLVPPPVPPSGGSPARVLRLRRKPLPSPILGCRRPAINGRLSLSLLRPLGWAHASLWSCRPAGVLGRHSRRLACTPAPRPLRPRCSRPLRPFRLVGSRVHKHKLK